MLSFYIQVLFISCVAGHGVLQFSLTITNLDFFFPTLTTSDPEIFILEDLKGPDIRVGVEVPGNANLRLVLQSLCRLVYCYKLE